MKENIIKVIKKFIDADANARNKFVLKYIGLFDAKQKLAEESIQRVIDLNRTNTCLTDVLIKVVMINTLYSTFLNSNSPEETRGDQIKEQGKRTLSVDQVARHIVEMANTKELDKKIEIGDIEAVKLICSASGENWKSIYSFATKYCNWHNQDKFPIIDKYSRGILYYINKFIPKQFYCLSKMRNDMLDYEKYCGMYLEFKKNLDLNTFTYKDIDKFLWMFGKDYYISYD